ncbi:hypothetical protein CVT25_004712 [Psilocybe cyanescens]|uniref:Uncharacterized protein n=1 Tax=Psilocybe cyanescens TaxID=93625 RepID=A0A409XIT2_PSICY|nr:hypothetical protein CVT25_004712 [Psilocybe cyanescens]
MAKAANPRNKTRPKPRPKAKAKVFADADAADVDVEAEAVDAEVEAADADVEAADARVKEKEKTAKGRLGAEEAGPGEVATEPAMAVPEEMEVDVDVGGQSNGDDGRDVGEEKRENGEDKEKMWEMEDPSSQIQWDHRLNTLRHLITTENNDSEEDRSPKETGMGLDTIVVKPCIPLGKGKKKALLSPEVPKKVHSPFRRCAATKKAKVTAPADPTLISRPQAGGSKNIGVASTSKSTSRTHSSSAFAKSTARRPTSPISKSRSRHSASALAKSTTRRSTPSVAGTSTSVATTSPKS